MVNFFKNFDFLILLPILVLAGFSLTIIWSVKPDLVSSQILFFLLGLALFFLFSQIDYRIFARFFWFFYLLSLLLLFLTLLEPQTRGAVRWLEIFGFRFQPSEIAKPLLLVFFASALSKIPIKNLNFLILKNLLFLSLPLILVFKQPDLGNTLIFLLMFFGITFGAGLSPILTLGALGFLGLSLPFIWSNLATYQKQRIFSFLNPQADPLGSGYNLLQSMITVGSGQFFGRGLGWGTQSHLLFLPERHTDFIFASLAEELGFFGSLILLGAYALLLARILKIATRLEDKFGILICFGSFSLLLGQIFINLGMNLGLLPITGITLPLVSYGGSSIVGTMIILGIVASVAQTVKKESFQIR